MPSLRQILQGIKPGAALGHFNISDSVALRAIFESAREVNVPVIIGVSEGEREFLGVRQAAALVKSIREEHDYPIFLNADHTHSIQKIKEAAEAGFDAVLFDPTPNFVGGGAGGSKSVLEESIAQTKEAVVLARQINPEIVVEGELGYIGSLSEILTNIPEGAAVKPEDLTSPEDAAAFVKETGVDLLAPAVGNVHGMFANAPNPRLDIARIREIKSAAGVPLVLHGGSGIVDGDFTAAIAAGIAIVHINTEIRLAWRRGMEKGLKNHPDEVAPYKIYPEALAAIKNVVKNRLAIFSGL